MLPEQPQHLQLCSGYPVTARLSVLASENSARVTLLRFIMLIIFFFCCDWL